MKTMIRALVPTLCVAMIMACSPKPQTSSDGESYKKCKKGAGKDVGHLTIHAKQNQKGATPPNLCMKEGGEIKVTFDGNVKKAGNISLVWKDQDMHKKNGVWLNTANGKDNNKATIDVPSDAGPGKKGDDGLTYDYAIYLDDKLIKDPRVTVDPQD